MTFTYIFLCIFVAFQTSVATVKYKILYVIIQNQDLLKTLNSICYKNLQNITNRKRSVFIVSNI